MSTRFLRLAGFIALFVGQTLFANPDSININTADAQAIADVLDGIGLKRAQAIVDYRDQHGVFEDAYDLALIKGIGDRTVEINSERIRLAD